MRTAFAIAALVIVMSSCTSGATVTTTNGSTTSAGVAATGESAFACISAPEVQRHSRSPFALSVSENPVVPGEPIALHIGSTKAYGHDPDDNPDITGYGSTWQCWNGTTWVDTHLLVHGYGGVIGRTEGGAPGLTTTVPAIGIAVPDTFMVTVPDVAPGWYRITAVIILPGAEGQPARHIEGFVAVEVLEE